MEYLILKNSITDIKCDAVVNSANQNLIKGSGICKLIYEMAGEEELNKYLEHADSLTEGECVATPAFNLPAKYILHTVGPRIQRFVSRKDEELLASCYRECLKLAADTGVESIAFCCISTGIFCFPQQRAAEIAVSNVRKFLNTDNRIKKVVFNVFKDEDFAIYSKEI